MTTRNACPVFDEAWFDIGQGTVPVGYATYLSRTKFSGPDFDALQIGDAYKNMPVFIGESNSNIIKVDPPKNNFNPNSFSAMFTNTNHMLYLPNKGKGSFSVGERLVSLDVYENYIKGHSEFKLGSPWDKSFFFNKVGDNQSTRSLQAAITAGFTRDNITNVINSGGNELVRIRFKLDKIQNVVIPGISRVPNGLGDGEIPGVNELFTGNGKIKTLDGDLSINEFIGDNVFLNPDDLISVDRLGKIKK